MICFLRFLLKSVYHLHVRRSAFFKAGGGNLKKMQLRLVVAVCRILRIKLHFALPHESAAKHYYVRRTALHWPLAFRCLHFPCSLCQILPDCYLLGSSLRTRFPLASAFHWKCSTDLRWFSDGFPSSSSLAKIGSRQVYRTLGLLECNKFEIKRKIIQPEEVQVLTVTTFLVLWEIVR